MAYQTFALKYRPRTFEEIVGQDHVATTLKNAVAAGRVAHGYLFAGPRGTGKTSTARVLAKALACERGPTPEPCCECEMCLAIDAGRALDLIEIDAASHRGIDEIRELREGVGYAPTRGRVKFYILDEAHMLTLQASNALLKTLEEPPPFVHFVLATTEPHEIIPTIRSRCQTFEFRPIPPALIVEALGKIAGREEIEVEEAALGAIARVAGGAMRDAESIFDQAIAFAGGPVTLQVVNSMLGVTDAELLAGLAEAVGCGDVQAVFRIVDEIVASGRDISQLVEDLTLYFRDLLRVSLGVDPPQWMQAPAAGRERMSAQAHVLGSQRLGKIIEELGEAAQRLRETAQQSLLLEVTLAHLAATAPAAPTNAPASQAELTLEGLRAQWQAVARWLEQAEEYSLLALTRCAQPVRLEGDTLTLSFPAEQRWNRDRVEEAYLARMREALEAVCGRSLQVRCELAAPSAAPAPATGESEAQREPPPPAQPAQEPAPQELAEPEAPGAQGTAEELSAREQERTVEALKLNFDGTEEQSG
ncbi:MAG: DNA polymerase III subunit gamma/tau [Armatimonadota bacterium]